MKLVSRLVLMNLLCLSALPAAAEDPSAQYNQQTSNNTQTISQYLQYLGGYLGYDLTQSPTANNQTISQQLLNLKATRLDQMSVYKSFFGAMPVNSATSALSQFVPTSFPGANFINQLANATFVTQNYSSPSNGGGTLSVSKLIDQETYQQDPVSQAVLNILSTPDYTYCMLFDLSAWDQNCKLNFQNKVIAQVVGFVPTINQFYTYQYNQDLISQLNSNALMAPLMYSSESTGQGTGSPTPSTSNPGLQAQTQIEEAANFIRYVSGAVVPGNLPSLQAYNSLYNTAYPTGKTTTTPMQQIQAQNTLLTYFANLRIYAAQSSVGIGNLYYILSKRLPQKVGTNTDNSDILSSQAMSEFKMASWRLFNPDLTTNNEWIKGINNASSATVQKEIATLLAEINYQMYLERQIQERLLLTNSIMLIQNTRSGQPSADFGANSSTGGGSNSTGGNP
ncbi:type IVB secretion system protein IcmX [Legionella sp. EUR-108]|uniref:Type IVB secretion system protein IcmX n=2 Tax=Legionella maioricensis TaxID=2896528 RepID=A0A9X2D2T3_9GAMM|nr:type IVB secretion system protein IcmX [Legionella maioricensis]MCL9685203.1 type IVB secretion system protein IcmX [Legionella maioricensis]MCL9688420.1 type IVB secretion system protein IcmX [Legionella maioricensis]